MTKKGKKSKPPVLLQPGMTMIPGQSYTMPDESFSLLRDENYTHPRQKRKARREEKKKRRRKVRRAVTTKQR